MASANKMCRLKYSCEEVYERMEKGLCIFCDELDIPGHHNLKHKGVQILLMEYDDDQVSEDKEEAHQETVKNPEPSKETMKNIEPETMKKYDPFVESLKRDSVLQVPDSFSDVFMVDKMDSHVKDVEEFTQQSTNDNGKNIALQVFDEMPLRVTNKEKQRKSLKAWRFKFKISFKRSKLMDDMFSVVEETVLLDKDPKETIWDCVKKEFKETMAACGKKRIDRFKLVHEISKPAVYDRPFQISVWDSGGSPLERVDEDSSGDDKPSEVIAAETVVKLMHKDLMGNKYFFVDESSGKDVKVLEAQQGFKTQVCSNFDVKAFGLENYGWEYKRQMLILTISYIVDVLSLDDGVFMTGNRLLTSPWDNQVWEPGGVSIEQGEWKWSEKCYERSRVMRLMQGLISVWWKGIKSREFDWCVTSNMGTRILLYWRQLESFWWFVNGKEFLDTGQKMQTTLIHEEEKNRLRNIKAGITTMSRELLICLGIHNMKLKGKVEICFRTHHNLRCLITHIVLETTKLHEICSLMSLQKNADVAIPLAKETQDWIVNTWFMVQAYRTELLVAGLSQLSLASMNFGQTFDSITEPKKILSSFFRLKHKWRSRLLQSFLELKQRTVVSLWKSFGYLMEAHGSKYEGLVCVLKRKKLRNIEDDINHLKKLLATMEGLAQKISCGLLCGDSKFHLKHKWKSRLIQALYGLQFVVENGVVFTSPDKLLFPNNHKLLHPETGFCTQYNDLELLNTEHQSSPGLDYFTYLNLIWKQVFNCGCEAGHISYGFFSVGDVNEFFICSNLQNGDETHGKRLLDWNEISLLDNDVKVNLTIKANWFYKAPMIRGVFHLQMPPELINLQGKPNFITKVPVQWKEHPPDQFFSSVYGQVLMLSSLRTRMF